MSQFLVYVELRSLHGGLAERNSLIDTRSQLEDILRSEKQKDDVCIGLPCVVSKAVAPNDLEVPFHLLGSETTPQKNTKLATLLRRLPGAMEQMWSDCTSTKWRLDILSIG